MVYNFFGKLMVFLYKGNKYEYIKNISVRPWILTEWLDLWNLDEREFDSGLLSFSLKFVQRETTHSSDCRQRNEAIFVLLLKQPANCLKEEKSCEFRRKRIKFTQKNTSNFLPFQHDTDFYSEFSFTQNDIRVSFQSKVGISLDKNSSIFFNYKLDDNKLDQRKMWLHHRQKLKVFNDLWPFYTIVQIIND